MRLLAGLPGFLGICAAINGCGPKEKAAAPPAFPTPVTAVMAVAQDVPIYLDEIGKTTASQSVIIVPQVSGIIKAKYFQDGDEVKQDQPLFLIDPAPFQAQLDQAIGQRKKDVAQQVSADWNVKQDTAAMETHSISEQTLHNDTSTLEQAIGSIAVDDAQIETANLNLGYCHIKSPINGRAGARLVDVGNVVTAAGQAPGSSLLSIQTLDPIYADFTITEAELLKVQQYQARSSVKLNAFVQLPQDALAVAGPAPATQPSAFPPGAEGDSTVPHPAVIGVPSPQQSGMSATAPAVAQAPAASLGLPRNGELIFLDNAVQDGSGTVKLRANVPNSDHHFWPNQFVNVRLVLTIQKGAVLVPSQSVQISQTGPFVFVVAADGTAQPHPVVQGQRQGEMVVIEKGIDPGDSVVVTGQTLLMPGGKVMVVNAPPKGAPAAAAAAPASNEGKQS